MAYLRTRAVVLSAALGAAGALRLDAKDVHQPRTAICVAGNAGTLPFSEIHNSLRNWVFNQKGEGLTKGDPDVFAYLTLEGLEKNREGWAYLGQNATYEQALYAIMSVGPLAYKIQEDHYEVTEATVDKYIKNKETCFANGVWGDSPKAMRKSLNQLAHWQHCLKMAFHNERIVGKKYEVVMLVRPDLAYSETMTMNLQAVSEGAAFRQKDWVLVLPRGVAGGLMNKRKAQPLSCSEGEACCGRVGSSATLLEYLTGLGATSLDACNCGPSVNETGLTDEHRTSLYIGRVIDSHNVHSNSVMLSVPFETVMTEHDGTEMI